MTENDGKNESEKKSDENTEKTNNIINSINSIVIQNITNNSENKNNEDKIPQHFDDNNINILTNSTIENKKEDEKVMEQKNEAESNDTNFKNLNNVYSDNNVNRNLNTDYNRDNNKFENSGSNTENLNNIINLGDNFNNMNNINLMNNNMNNEVNNSNNINIINNLNNTNNMNIYTHYNNSINNSINNQNNLNYNQSNLTNNLNENQSNNINQQISFNNNKKNIPSDTHSKNNNSNVHKKSSGDKKKGMKDFAFKFPLENSFSKVEIPFAFQQNLEKANNSRFHSYITIKDTPKLYIDISDDKKMDKFKLSTTIESLKASNEKQENKLQNIDTNIMKLNNENELIRDEITKIKNEIMINNNKIEHIKNTKEQINQNEKKFDLEFKQKINEKSELYLTSKEKYENLFSEISAKTTKLTEEEKKEYLSKIIDEISKINKQNNNNLNYYSKKYSNNLYTEDYIIKTLQNDLLDFCQYVALKIKTISPKVKELIQKIQNSVDNSIGNNYEVKLYGSHATGLCLPWSDIDVVICNKNSESNENCYVPLHELYTYLQNKHNNEFKSINFIGSTTIPLIKIKTKENIGIQSVDISLQDKGHYGLKCVSLVLSYKEEYEVLLPMILALKNILKKANLNDPYKVSKFYNIFLGWFKFLWISFINSTFFKNSKRARKIIINW